MTTKAATASARAAEYRCPVHLIRLTYVLAGGAGHCVRCGLFVQSANHPLPTLDTTIAAKRAAAQTARSQAEAERQCKRTAVKEGRARLCQQATSAGACTSVEVKR